jgi:hypothetical protein
MWISKNSKELLENLKSHGFSKTDIIKTYNSSTFVQQFFTTKLSQITDKSFFKQKWHQNIQISSDWETRYIFCETPF